MKSHVALLRGINVGGKNRLPMTDLAACMEALGCTGVRTYIQSGNAIFEGDGQVMRRVREELPQLVEERFGFRPPVIVRSAEDLAHVLSANPFLAGEADPKHLHVGFLGFAPGAAAIAALDPARSDVDSFAVSGREVYLHVPGGMARTRLTTDWFDRRLGTPMTVRNWRTVTKLAEMLTG